MSRRLALAGGVLAVAVAVVAATVAGLFLAHGPSGFRAAKDSAGTSTDTDIDPLMAELIAAAGDLRPVEGRLTRGFAYAPLARGVRGAASGAATSSAGMAKGWQVLAAASRLQRAVEANPSPESAHALGLAHLVLDEVEAATEALEQAGRAAPVRPELLSDLAAAWIERAESRGEAEDLVRALDAAGEALSRAPDLPEARFNRALALEKLFLRSRAAAAWDEYLALDPDSRWSAEARERVTQLRGGRAKDDWDPAKARMRDLALGAGSTRAGSTPAAAPALRDIIGAQSQSVREWIEEELLAAWGDHHLAGRQAEAERELEVAEVLARSLSDVTGDRMAPEATAAIRHAGRGRASEGRLEALARGHRAYRDGLLAYRRSELEAAARLFEAAEADLRRGSSPFVAWARFHLSVCAYHQGGLEGAIRRLEPLGAESEKAGHVTLAGRASWMMGLIERVRANLGRAPAHYERAIAFFERAGEAENIAALHGLMADALAELGNFAGSWRHYRHGLSLLERARSPLRIYNFHVTIATAAVSQGFPRAALEFQTMAVETARVWGNPVAVSEAQVWRARLRCDLREPAAALEDLAEAERWLGQVTDATMRARVEAEALATRGLILRDEDPMAGAEAIGRSLAYFERTGAGSRLALLELERGRAFLAAGRDEEAEAAFLAAIRTFERHRANLGAADQRISYFDLSRQVFDEMISFEADRRGRLDLALEFAERARARQLQDNLLGAADDVAVDDTAASDLAAGATAKTVLRLRDRLPAGVAVLYFATLPDRMLVWVITERSIDPAQSALTVSGLADRVASFRAALQRDDGETEVGREADALHEDLIGPLRHALAGAETLVIVPDGPLNVLPFAALRNPATGRFLVQDFRIGIAPSATLLLAGATGRRGTGKGAGVVWAKDDARNDAPDQRLDALVVGNPLFSRARFGHLPDLPGAESEATRVAALYPVAARLIGPDATKRRFLAEASRRSIIHFAGHAIPNEQRPELSALILAPEEGGEDEGVLFARDVATLRLERARLVVLSACATAGGRQTRSEGVLNLARPFLAVGVPAVVASLWDVQDDSSALLFVRFHERLRAGSSPLDALRLSQIEALGSEDPALRRPAVWAAFSLITTSPL